MSEELSMLLNSEDTRNLNVVVLGNGFDLHLGLKSSFSSFFSENVIDQNHYFKSDNDNLLLFLMYLRFYRKGKPSYQPLFYPVYSDNPNWMDVEGFVKELATNHKILEGLYSAMSFRKQGVHYVVENKMLIEIGTFLNKLNLESVEYDKSTIKRLLADNLSEFEKQFAEYVKKKISDRDEYARRQLRFILTIFDNIDTTFRHMNVEVINFNYTKNSLNLYKENNVHGTIDSKVVIGYDSTQSPISNADIYEMSKDWRKIDIDIDSDCPYGRIENIIVYGHSLGEQDYPYFFEIFDKCRIVSDESRTNIYEKQNFKNKISRR